MPNQWALANQFLAQGNQVQAQSAQNAANNILPQAHKALDELILRSKDSDGVINDIANVK
jgi:hypothetical protein